MIRFWLAATVLAVMIMPTVAQIPPAGGAPGLLPPAGIPSGPAVMAPSAVTTSRGAGLVTGTPGSPQMIMIPGSAVPGMLMNNGNGTSSIMVPGGASEVVPTPR